MAYYMEKANRLRMEVEDLMDKFRLLGITQEMSDDYAVRLAHIISSAVLCNPRAPQGTVRKNIVAEAMKKYCTVTMTKEPREDDATKHFNKIHIHPLDVEDGD